MGPFSYAILAWGSQPDLRPPTSELENNRPWESRNHVSERPGRRGLALRLGLWQLRHPQFNRGAT